MRILYVENGPHDADLTVRRLHNAALHFQVEGASTIHEARAVGPQIGEAIRSGSSVND